MTAATYAFGRSLRDRWAIVGLVALGVGVPAVIGVLSGSIVIPHKAPLYLYRVDGPGC